MKSKYFLSGYFEIKPMNKKFEGFKSLKSMSRFNISVVKSLIKWVCYFKVRFDSVIQHNFIPGNHLGLFSIFIYNYHNLPIYFGLKSFILLTIFS